MSSAFPQQASHNAFGPGAAAVPVPERGTHIPAFYVRNPHHDPDLVVCQNGVPLLGYDKRPFTIAHVAPERRWAVLADGNLMDQNQFNALKQQSVFEFYQMLKETGHPDAKYEGNIAREPIPDVAYFVRWRVDPDDQTRLLEIGYDPNATDGAVAEHFHDSKGDEIIASRMEVLCAAYADRKGRAQMTDREREEVEKHLGVSAAAGSDGVAAKLEVLTELHRDGTLSSDDYLRKVSELTGVGPGQEPAGMSISVSPAKQPMTARCGKCDCKGEVGLKSHERRCRKCLQLAAEEGEAA